MTINTNRRLMAGGLNYYVPGLQYDAGLIHGAPCLVSLGSPAAADDDLIAATVDGDAVAGTTEAYSWTADSPYGRTLQVKVSADPGVLTSVIDVHGYDYLGQPMKERFTTLNGSTAIQYGKKAFYKTTKTVIVTAATNAITLKVGTALRLGIPFKTDVQYAKENGILVGLSKRDVTVWRQMAGAAVAGGPSGAWVYADFPGFVKSIRTTADMPAGSTNDPATTVELGGTAIVGLTVTADVSAAATGSLLSDDPTTAGYSANNRFVKGDLIEIVNADADSSGAISVGLVLTPTQVVLPDTTDPATAITGDPRGTYETLTTLAGFEVQVALVADPEVNASGHGGLHGIQHYYA